MSRLIVSSGKQGICCGSKIAPPISPRAQAQQQQQQPGAARKQRVQLDQAGLYTMLGLRPGSSKQEVKQAYRRLALKYHPDVCTGEHCAPRFQQISAAYHGLLVSSLELSYGGAPSYYSEEEDDEDWQGGWEGAWMF